ncbi:hypothetical protein [Bdellovibrio svalbardensis]|uniref:YcxB-like protein domain-containing protein n=1 Tax=Bdellovibrio svalbardensis TaxID=2972972 RepID=A0ABT6DJR3_9BACT|nr:hypothetical protein [Bdellovibrio svalbardensis]MDG0816455.1 hypothetical protein [Bdellovibrio svalbardensis]
MIKVSPKILASSYLVYLFRRFRYCGGWSAITWLKAYSVTIALAFLTAKVSPSSIGVGLSQVVLNALLFGSLFFVTIFLVGGITLYLFLWNTSWQYGDKAVLVKSIFGSKEYQYSQIKKTTLESRYMAILTIELPDATFHRTTHWFGRDRTDWNEFVNFLSRQNGEVRENIFVSYFRGFKQFEKKLSADEAYSFFEDGFPKIGF